MLSAARVASVLVTVVRESEVVALAWRTGKSE